MTPDDARYRPLGAFALCSLIWGSTFLVIRFSNDSFAPVFGAGLRLVLASLVLVVLTLVLGQRFPRGRFLTAAVLYGLFEFGINLPFLYWGEESTPSGVAAILYTIIPLTTILFGWLLGVEAPTRRKVLAAVLAVAGVAVVFGGETSVAVPLPGLLAVLVAAVTAGLATVLLRRAPQQPAVPLNAVATAVGAPMALAASVFLGESHTVPGTLSGWWPVLYLTVMGSLVAFVAMSWLVQVWPPSRATMVTVVIPVVAVALGAIVVGEQPSALAYVGGAIVLAAVILALRAEGRETEASGS